MGKDECKISADKISEREKKIFNGYHGGVISAGHIPVPITTVSEKEIQKQLEEGPGEFDYEETYREPWATTATESAVRDEIREMAELQQELMQDIFGFSCMPKEYLYPNKESEKQMGEKEMWTLYEVIIIDKEKPELLTDKSGEYYVAKTPEMALAKAGYYDYLEKKDHDTTKLVKKVAAITDIRPVKDE